MIREEAGATGNDPSGPERSEDDSTGNAAGRSAGIRRGPFTDNAPGSDPFAGEQLELWSAADPDDGADDGPEMPVAETLDAETLDAETSNEPAGEGSCRVSLMPSGRTITVERGTLLMDAARAAGLPVAQSCGGVAVCSWCRMQVLAGLENLSEIEPNEARLIKRQAFMSHERASCQAEILGDVTVTTTYW